MRILLTILLLWTSLLSAGLRAQTLTLPADLTKYNVRAYGAKGDGVSDDTQAIQAAIDEGRNRNGTDNTSAGALYGLPKLVYFPAGTYLISNTLTWNECSLSLQGQGQDATVIKLRYNAAGFGSAAAPRPLVQSPDGNRSFHQNVWDLTLDSGRGNPGAIGLDFIANNSGAVRNVRLRSGDGAGLAGLDLTRYGAGPCLFKNLEIVGFDLGIRVGNPEYGPTFEHLVLSGQRVAGIQNTDNVLNIRGLTSTNAGPALVNRGRGHVVLLDAVLSGGAAGASALDNQESGQVYLRNVTATGYASALRQGGSGGAAVPGLTLAEYASGPVAQLFDGPKASLNLPVEETPDYVDNDLSHWVGIPEAWVGDNRGWQPVFDSGQPVVYFPNKFPNTLPVGGYAAYDLSYPVPVSVRRIWGCGAFINSNGHPSGRAATFVVNTGTATDPPLIVDDFGAGVRVLHQSARPVVIRHGAYRYEASPGAGKLYLEDVEMDPLVVQPDQQVWARQLNSEGPTQHLTNPGGTLWVLGLKTEGTGTVATTTNGGRTEVLGGLLYPANAFTGADGPAFSSTDASVSYIYSTSSYTANGNYPVQVRETRGGVTRTLGLDGLTGRALPLFAGYAAPAPPPVVLTQFEAVRQGADVRLSWSTASEYNSRGFHVEVAATAEPFRALAFVPSPTASSSAARSYSYLDTETGKAGTRYYRLSQEDLSTPPQLTYSPVRAVSFVVTTAAAAAPAVGLAVAPVPAGSGEAVRLFTHARQAAETSFTLTDALGRVVRRGPLRVPAGAASQPLPALAGLPAGGYVLHVVLAGQAQRVRVLVD